MHPSDVIRGAASDLLAGKRVILGVSGSISAVRAVEVAREIIRHGADVIPVMTPSAERIIHPDALEFATGHRTITRLTGAVEHVDLKGDLMVVAPATGNTVAKIALGIDDTPVTTFATTHLGVAPVLIAPAMHGTMYENPFLVGHLERLRAAGVEVLDPVFEERKAKLADPVAIAEHAVRLAGPRTLKGRRVLVVAGSTEEPLDAMRVVSNRGTGAFGAALAREAFRLGAEVELWWGRASVEPPAWIPTKRFATVADLLTLAPEARRFDAVVMPAAVSDWAPAAPQRGKIPTSEGETVVRLAPTPKVAKAIRAAFDGALVTFKAESGLAPDALAARAREALAANGAAFVVANDVANAGRAEASVLVVDAKGVAPLAGPKDRVARGILDRLAKVLGGAA
ncbi:MAG TPA: bifunctional phosphopantothenoylcysteine decarboxylase/phosphopantothenate--cysteine ligase CoaBC [Candidatus Thermoplasmatota archaeon]|nr:bifunctional phosphopantothenoylcysteine decarboxylase/phosphopantothenate--cysteine ligase CoaBC [Candidatus Thermoplasmatota archaeon]